MWRKDTDGYKSWEAAAYPELRQRFTDWWKYVHAKRGFVQLFRYRMREGGELCPGLAKRIVSRTDEDGL